MIRRIRAWYRRNRSPIGKIRHRGATVGYARELHALATAPAWLTPEEEASAARLAATEQTTRAIVRRLHYIEHRTQAGLDELWQRTCAALDLDPLDIEWATLASGELITT